MNMPKATMARLTPLSIISTHMSIAMALRRARKPNVPMANMQAGEDEVRVERVAHDASPPGLTAFRASDG